MKAKFPSAIRRLQRGKSIFVCGLFALLWALLAPKPAQAQSTNAGEIDRVRPAVRLELNPAKVVLVGQFSREDSKQDVKFNQPARGRYFCLETLSAHDGRPYAAVAELNLLDEHGHFLSRSNWTIAYADSEEHERENGSAENVFDGDPTTFWHTQWGTASPNHPHHLVIDIGSPHTITGFSYLPRPGIGSVGGRIKDYRIYVGDDLIEQIPQTHTIPEKIFLFGYFVGDSSDGLHFAYSLDGYRWDTMNQGSSVLKPEVGAKLMRDPSLSRGFDGLFHLVWTAAWTGNYIGHATSKDLVHWSEQTTIPVMTNFPHAMNCWAPEMYWDTNQKDCVIFWSSAITNTASSVVPRNANQIFCTTTKDFKTFSPVKLMFAPSYGVLDATVVPYHGRFHMIYKDDSISRLRMAVADRVEGPYKAVGLPFASDPAEGPAILHLDNKFLVYYHIISPKNNGAVMTENFEEWKDFSAGVFLPLGSQQGTFLQLDTEELKPLSDAGLLETGITPEASELGIGNWIWTTNLADRQTCRFWRSFFIPDDTSVTHALFKITADNGYTVYLDGEEIGRGGDPNNLTEYDLTWLMSPGRHILAVEAFNDSFDAGMIAGLQVNLANGKKVELFSDSSWRIVANTDKAWKTEKQANLDWPLARVVGYAGRMWWEYPNQITRVPPLLPVSKHFWKETWFLVLLLVICTLIIGLSILQGLQLAVQARSHRQLERERARIAADLHDDLGSGLTQLTLLGELVLQESSLPGDASSRLQKLCAKARTALKSMDEIIWTVNPKRDTIQDFVAFILEYAQEYLATTSVRCRLDVPDNLPSIPLDLPARRNLLLAFKEAVRNVARHSGATELSLKVHLTDRIFYVILRDNGKGFDLDSNPKIRNGLSNMQERLTDIGGHCAIQAARGKGCEVSFMLPVQQPDFSSKKWLARILSKLFRH